MHILWAKRSRKKQLFYRPYSLFFQLKQMICHSILSFLNDLLLIQSVSLFIVFDLQHTAPISSKKKKCDADLSDHRYTCPLWMNHDTRFHVVEISLNRLNIRLLFLHGEMFECYLCLSLHVIMADKGFPKHVPLSMWSPALNKALLATLPQEGLEITGIHHRLAPSMLWKWQKKKSQIMWYHRPWKCNFIVYMSSLHAQPEKRNLLTAELLSLSM